MSVPLLILPMHCPDAAEYGYLHSILHLSTPTITFEKHQDLPSSLPFPRSGCMDSIHHGWETSDPNRDHAQSSFISSRQRTPEADLSFRHPSTSPLPQTQWADVPVSYHPLEWTNSDPESSNSDPARAWRLRRPISGRNLSAAEQSAQEHRHHRPRHLRSLFHRHGDRPQSQVTEHSALYPPVDPYPDFAHMVHARDRLQQVRSVSQPASPDFKRLEFEMNDTLLTGLSQASPHPSSSTHHARTGTTNDAVLADPEDFHLFAQATSGLESDPSFPLSAAASFQESQQHQQRPWLVLPPHDVDHESSIVPLEAETPTLMQASQIALMPQQLRHQAMLPAQVRSSPQLATRSVQPGQQQVFVPGLPHYEPPSLSADTAPWQYPPSESTQLDLEALGLGDISPTNHDDELPDYASSQAEAQAAQRMDAVRRAAELQIRWQRSNR
nr:hypothetical protein CFP56_11412 [Quercus suber]